jgi:hypothetical protein
MLIVGVAFTDTVVVAMALQPLLIPVTLTVYVPAVKPVKLAGLAVLLVNVPPLLAQL